MTTPVYGEAGWGPPQWVPDTDLTAERAIQYIIDVLISYLALVPPMLLALVGLANGATAPFYVVLVVLGCVLSYGWSFWIWVWHPHRHGSQTWGMRVKGIKVVDAATIGPTTLSQLSIRWLLLLVIDGGWVGLLLIAFTDRHQRLGDMAANTYVVREETEPPAGPPAEVPPPVYR